MDIQTIGESVHLLHQTGHRAPYIGFWMQIMARALVGALHWKPANARLS